MVWWQKCVRLIKKRGNEMPCELLRLMFGPLSSDGASKIRKGLTLSTKALSQWDYMRHSGCQFSDKALRLRPAEGGPSRGACLLRLASRYMPSGRTCSSWSWYRSCSAVLLSDISVCARLSYASDAPFRVESSTQHFTIFSQVKMFVSTQLFT